MVGHEEPCGRKEVIKQKSRVKKGQIGGNALPETAHQHEE